MSHDAHSHHITSPQLLWATFAALVALTLLTVAVSSYVHLERFPAQVFLPMVFDDPVDVRWLDMPITLAIATAKALLVAVIFMHLQHDKLFNAILLIGAVVFMVLFIGMALLDSGQYQPQVETYTSDKEAMQNP
ncbi:cytochrome C oxidase subunit IV family protein [Botrimarina sp.]|uniref:cytochrome C oxidase subunit IV family protein n=1 Tax=Botrimarina sp. TaxID=2795802 RepID=UPI0032EED3D4